MGADCPTCRAYVAELGHVSRQRPVPSAGATARPMLASEAFELADDHDLEPQVEHASEPSRVRTGQGA